MNYYVYVNSEAHPRATYSTLQAAERRARLIGEVFPRSTVSIKDDLGEIHHSSKGIE